MLECGNVGKIDQTRSSTGTETFDGHDKFSERAEMGFAEIEQQLPLGRIKTETVNQPEVQSYTISVRDLCKRVGLDLVEGDWVCIDQGGYIHTRPGSQCWGQYPIIAKLGVSVDRQVLVPKTRLFHWLWRQPLQPLGEMYAGSVQLDGSYRIERAAGEGFEHDECILERQIVIQGESA